MDFSYDDFLGGKIKLKQEKNGYRATSDAVTLAAAVEGMHMGAKILDVGSGTGAVSLCIAARIPDAEITGIELQENYVALANENAEMNLFSDRVKFFQGNVLDKKTLLNESFDCVVSNPPFMDKNDYASPDASRDKTRREKDFGAWLEFCVRRTRDNGKLFFICKPEKIFEALDVLVKKTGAIKIIPLYSKKNSAAKKIIVCATKSSRGKLEILPGVALHDDDGKTSGSAVAMQKHGKSLFEASFDE